MNKKWYYLIKITKDSEGNITARKIICRMETPQTKRGDYISIEGELVENPIIEFDQNGEASIVEDTVKRDKAITRKEIEQEAARIFKKEDSNALMAEINSSLLRAMFPEKYIAEGLEAGMAIGTFLEGDSLNTTTKIKDYYSEVLFKMDKFKIDKLKGSN